MKILARVVLILAGVYLPILGLWYMTGLSGSNPFPHVIMAISHIAIVVAAYLALKNPRYFVLVAVAGVAFCYGYQADKSFWLNHNQDVCAQIKADPNCSKNAAGYVCREPSPLGNMAVGKDMCL